MAEIHANTGSTDTDTNNGSTGQTESHTGSIRQIRTNTGLIGKDTHQHWIHKADTYAKNGYISIHT